MGQAKQHRAERKSFSAAILDRLASVKFAVSVVVIIAIACVAGTILPQGADVAKYLQKNPAAADRIEFFGKLGLTHVFSTWWFIALLCLLAATVATCSARRFATVRRATGYAQRRALGSMITHISILLILAGGVIRGVWGEKGYLEFREGEMRANFVTERGVKALPFALHLTKFEIETYDQQPASAQAKAEPDCCNQLLVKWPERNLAAALPIKLDEEQLFGTESESFRIKILRYVPDFIIDMDTREVTTRSDRPRNPAILVAVSGPNYKNNRWLFAKFPSFITHTADGHASGPSPLEMVYVNHGAEEAAAAINGPIKSFKSTLSVLEGEKAVQTRTIEVNSPLSYKGYTFYQSGYDPKDLSYTSLQVVKDPGVPVVYAGFTLMIVGLFIVFYLNPWLDARRRGA